MKNVVKEVVDAQERSDEKFLELEEKRMKFKKREEREFQMQMMTMLFGGRGPQASPASNSQYNPYGQFHWYSN